jgi:hypothetical protein
VVPTAIKPLYDTIDPDALDAVFAEPRAFDENPITATFVVSNCRVIIQNDGTLSVFEA